MKSTNLARLAAALLAGPTVASAAPVTWTLDGVFFQGAGTAGGSFVYDAASATFSDIALTASTGRTYTQFAGASAAAGLVFLQSGVTSGSTIALGLKDIALSLLTDAGGELRINTASSSAFFAEFSCTALAGCIAGAGTSGNNWQVNGVSTLTGVPLAAPVPEPGGLALLGLAVAGLATARRRRH